MRIQRSTKTTHLQKHLRRCEGEIHLPQVPHLVQKDVHDATNAVYDIAQQQSDKAADKCEKKSSKCSGSAHALSICCIRRSAYVPMMSTLAACDGRVSSRTAYHSLLQQDLPVGQGRRPLACSVLSLNYFPSYHNAIYSSARRSLH